MENISIIDIKNNVINNFFTSTYDRLNGLNMVHVPDDFVLKLATSSRLENLTDDELAYIHIKIGLKDEKLLSNLIYDKNEVSRKLDEMLSKFICEKNGEMSIYELNFSPRINKALNKKGIKTVEKLKMLDENYLINLRNLGPKCIDEIKEKMHEHGIKFIFEYSEEQEKNFEEEKESNIKKEKVKQTPLTGLNLSPRSYNSLVKKGIFTVEKLTMCGKEELKCLRNLGNKSFEEIIEKVHEHGEKFVFEYPLDVQLKIIECERQKEALLKIQETMEKYNNISSRLKKIMESDIDFKNKENSIFECIEKMDQIRFDESVEVSSASFVFGSLENN